MYPIGEVNYLKKGLELIILDDLGEIFLKAQARMNDSLLQLEFQGEVGDKFSVKVVLEDINVTEDFVI